MNELIEKCLERGIDVKITTEEILREIHVTFSKDNKHYRKIFPYNETPILPRTFINSLVLEADRNLNH